MNAKKILFPTDYSHLSDAALEAKVRSCCDGVLTDEQQARLINAARSIANLSDTTPLMETINGIEATIRRH